MNPDNIKAIADALGRGVEQAGQHLAGEAQGDLITGVIFAVITVLCAALTWKFFRKCDEADGIDEARWGFSAIVSGIVGVLMLLGTFAFACSASKNISTIKNPNGAAVRVLFEKRGN